MIWRWPSIGSLCPPEFRLEMGEGETPLVRSRRIGPGAGLQHLHFKVEGTNPSGSYKDRFAAVAVADMLRQGKRRCVATSSGNTGSALAAYCAVGGVACDIVVVETAPDQKLKQMAAYGAKLLKVRGFGTDADITAQVFAWVQERGRREDSSLQISAYTYSPVGMAGVQSIGFEIAEQCAGVQHVFVPAGGGGLALAIARAFTDADCRRQAAPRVHVVQPVGNDTIASALRQGKERAQAVSCTTQISGLQVPTVIDGNEVIAACRASGGTGYLVSDQAIWEVQRRLACEEGIFCEPAGAASVAGALAAAERGEVAPGERVCCVISGTGFKDLPSIDRMVTGGSIPLVEHSEMAGW